MALTSGERLGPYEIQSPVGAGGMGEVYRARDTRLERTVAVKILPSHLSENPEAKQRFDREARAISSLNHPNICTLFDVGHQGGIDFHRHIEIRITDRLDHLDCVQGRDSRIMIASCRYGKDQLSIAHRC